MLFAWTCEPDDGPRRAKASYQYYYVDLLAARLKGRLSIRAQKTWEHFDPGEAGDDLKGLWRRKTSVGVSFKLAHACTAKKEHLGTFEIDSSSMRLKLLKPMTSCAFFGMSGWHSSAAADVRHCRHRNLCRR